MELEGSCNTSQICTTIVPFSFILFSRFFLVLVYANAAISIKLLGPLGFCYLKFLEISQKNSTCLTALKMFGIFLEAFILR